MTTDTEGIINIINAVKARECLWNVQSADYAKRDKLERAWKNVAQEVGKTENFCREKWRNVRTGFLRSIQNNFRLITDESSNETIQTIQRKRFYLYEQMKFLLPAAESLEETRKKRKRSKRIVAQQDIEEDFGSFSDTANTTLSEYKSICKYETRENNGKLGERKRRNNVSSCYEQLLEQLHEESTIPLAKEGQPKKFSRIVEEHLCEENQESVVEEGDRKSIGSEVGTPQNHISTQTSSETFKSCPQMSIINEKEHTAKQLLDFFRGNLDDIITLSKRKQRLFKRRMLELIEELHESEDGGS